MADTQREAFEVWASNEFPDYFMDKDPVGDYYAEPIDASWKGWRAALASRPAEVDDEGLPPLPKDSYRNPITGNMPWFSTEQYRQGQHDAVAADRARFEAGDQYLLDRMKRFEGVLLKIATVNAMDYEYRKWAIDAIAPFEEQHQRRG